MVYPVGRDNRFLEGKSIYYGLPGKGKRLHSIDFMKIGCDIWQARYVLGFC